MAHACCKLVSDLSSVLEFEIWFLGLGSWNLVPGIWNFKKGGISPSLI
jgi:hypothetical protein